MTFSEITQLLHRFIFTDLAQWEFVQRLIYLIMHEPISDADKELNEKDEYYPYCKANSKSAAVKIYQGGSKRNLPIKKAQFMLAHYNKTALIDAIHELDDDPKDRLCEGLNAKGIPCTFENVPEAIADAIALILEARANKQEGYIFGAAVAPVQPEKKKPDVELGQVMQKGPVYVVDDYLYYPGRKTKLPPALQVKEKISAQEALYTSAILEAYASALDRASVTADKLASLPAQYAQHFTIQSEAYFAAEYVRESVRDVFSDGERQFKELEEEYDGIAETYWADYKNGFERLNAVLKQAINSQLNKSNLYHISRLIGIREMKGLCHVMVNDGTIRSWVNIDG